MNAVLDGDATLRQEKNREGRTPEHPRRKDFDVCDLALLTSMVAAKVAANITAKIAKNIIAIERVETKLQCEIPCASDITR
jgi:hypothetical protein